MQRNTTFFPTTEAFVNTLGASYCSTQGEPGLFAFIRGQPNSIHGQILNNGHWNNGVIGGPRMRDWVGGAMTNPAGLTDEIQVGAIAGGTRSPALSARRAARSSDDGGRRARHGRPEATASRRRSRGRRTSSAARPPRHVVRTKPCDVPGIACPGRGCASRTPRSCRARHAADPVGSRSGRRPRAHPPDPDRGGRLGHRAARGDALQRLQIRGIPTNHVERLRRGEPDANGQAPLVRVAESRANPCRHCLDVIADGDTKLVLSYRPFAEAQPYAETGPIFLHQAPCLRYEADAVPAWFQFMDPVIVRGYGENHWIRYETGTVVAGAEIETTCRSILADPTVAYVHVRSKYDCFQCRVDRG